MDRSKKKSSYFSRLKSKPHLKMKKSRNLTTLVVTTNAFYIQDV